MKFKVGSAVFDQAESVPMMIEVTEADRKNIANMDPEATQYAVFPDDWGTADEKREWMQAGMDAWKD